MNLQNMFQLLRILAEFRKHEHWSRSHLEELKTESLHHMREYAYAYSPFYQKFHQGLFDQPLNKLPVLTKAMMMEHYDELVTDRAIHLDELRAHAANDKTGEPFLNRYRVTATSGSSGHPGFFLFNPKEWLYVLASFARSQEWSGVRIDLTRRQRMVTVASISPWHMSSQVAASAKSWWRPSLRLPASQPLSQTVEQLNEWQPEMLIAYASMASTLAEEQLAKRLHIQPRVVYAASEVLTQQTRQRALQAWGDEPFNQYVATEAASIAAEYRVCRRMHFFDDLVIAEVVNEDYRSVLPGEYGAKILITTLFSRTQPLIRYELNDSVRVNVEDHGCGLPFAVLDSIQGRVEDVLHLPATNGSTVVVQPLVFNRVMDIVPVSGWQVVQQADNGLEVLLTGENADLRDELLAEQLTRSLAQEGARVPYINVRRVVMIPKSASGKRPLVKSKEA
jgi:phenylacetate-coenzyme A ligase PaaK-like adenylate-forming protein